MLRSTLDAPAPAGPQRAAPRGRSFRGRLTSVMAAITGRIRRDRRLRDPLRRDPLRRDSLRPSPLRRDLTSQAPDAGHAPAQDGPADSVARRFATQRDAEATHRIWRSAAVGGGPGLR